MLRRLATPPVEAPDSPTTTALGDWYANLVQVGRTQLVLCTSDRSLLSIVVPAREVRRQLVAHLRQGLHPLLADLGVSVDAIDQELEGMQTYSVGRTASRKVLGHMRDFALNIAAALDMQPGMSLHTLSGRLSQIPCGPVEYTYPAEVARDLLEGQHRRRTKA